MELSELTTVIGNEDRQVRLDGMHSVVLPVLEKEFAAWRRHAQSRYGGGWDSLFEVGTWPRRRTATATASPLTEAVVGLVPRERQRGLYRIAGARGGQAKKMALALNVSLNEQELITELSLRGAGVIRLFTELIGQYHDFVVALLERAHADIATEPRVLGPPCASLANQLEAALQSETPYLVFQSPQTAPSWNGAAAFAVCENTFSCLLPVAVALTQMALRAELSLDYHYECLQHELVYGTPAGDQRVTPKLRFDILDRDNRTCQACGKSAPEVKLHVDHKHPVAEGGTNDPSNLWTLCQECNLGKGRRVFRSIYTGSLAFDDETEQGE